MIESDNWNHNRHRGSQRLQCAAREFLLQICVALITSDQLAQHFANAAMAAGKIDHAIREWRTPKVSIKPPPHLRRSFKFGAKILAPLLFVRQRFAGEISLREQL